LGCRLPWPPPAALALKVSFGFSLGTGFVRLRDVPTRPSPPPKPALVHDYLLVLRGAERTFAAMADLWPGAPLYTLLYDAAGTRGRFSGRVVRTSRLQRLGIRQDGFRRLLPLFPPAADRLGSGRHPLVVSSSSAFAHRTTPSPGGVHLCYCHSPLRYLWHERERAREEVPAVLAPALDLVLSGMRRSDVAAAREVTTLLANSRITQQRIADVWGRDSEILHPPVQVDRFRTANAENWFLTVGELVRHKRTEVALEAARRAGARVKVVGTGPERERLQALYGDTAEFLGRVGDHELADLYSRARAFVMPNVEEFGIAAVEAQAAGRPVVAIDAGGARETVIDGGTGILVPAGDEGALAEALRHGSFDSFDPSFIADHARNFSVEAFQCGLLAAVEQAWAAR